LKRTGEKRTPEQRVLDFIREQRLLPPEHPLLVAVSGGADSVCLLNILASLRKELGIDLYVAHLNHRLRGADSDDDAGYVADLAKRLSIPAVIEARDVNDYRTTHHLSLEEAAREVRYSFLAGVAGSLGAERVAVGHTLDDNVETILMHLIRGSGTRGLRGLLPLSRWQSPESSIEIVRPLLPLSRDETAAYCRQNELHPRLDASNLSQEPMRNRIRHRLLPRLSSYNPRITEALLRTAGIAADELAFMDAETARRRQEIVRRDRDTVILDKKAFLDLHPALQRHLLRASIEEMVGDLKDIEAGHIEEMMDALDKPAGKKITLPGGFTFNIEYNRYLLCPDGADLSPFPALEIETTLNIPGKTIIPGWEIEAVVLGDSEGSRKHDDFTACLDMAKSGKKLAVRSRRPGDRFHPLGLDGSKKLNEFMIDARIPQGWRNSIPIVASEEHIVWVVGWRIDERVKVTDATKDFLRLVFKRVPSPSTAPASDGDFP